MGCTPSIHTSQTGVIHRQETEERRTSYTVPSDNNQLSGIPGNYRPDYSPERSEMELEERRSPQPTTQVESPSWTFARMVKKGVGTGEKMEKMTWVPPQVENNVVTVGPFRLTYEPLKVLLLFPLVDDGDSQSEYFDVAASKLRYVSQLVRNPECALVCYQENYHDVVIVDGRYSRPYEAEAVCRALRAVNGSENTIVVVIIRKSDFDKEEATVIQFLNAGFNRCLIECPSLAFCINELIQLEINDVRTRLKIQATQTLITALANCRDVVEITNANGDIQYVNPSGEQLLGYSAGEIVGKKIHEVHKLDSSKAQVNEAINTQLQSGKDWEGVFVSRRKSGDSIALPCKILPTITRGNKPTHHIYIKECGSRSDRALAELANGKENMNISSLNLFHRGSMRSIRKSSYDVKSLNEISSLINRRQSMARIHALTIEAPITKVINLISATQENCPTYISQALDKVLDILRSTELYSPQLLNQQSRTDDPITIDLLGGLLSQGPKVPLNARRQSEITFSKGQNLHPSLSLPSLPILPPNIKSLLEKESKWSFDVLQLERVTNKRPLVWLGMVTFARFRVAKVLGIDEVTLQNWLTLIEANYHSQNPYHNSTHAADVLQAAAYFLGRDHIKQIFDPLDEAACLIAAAIHDVDHPGKNSAFLCNSNNELAILYNDLSVLESHHAAIAFKLTNSDKRVNIFRNMEKDDYRSLRQSIIDMVLATEMTKHFEHLSKFVNSLTKPMLSEEIALELDQESSENIILVKRMLIKCADVSNPARELDFCIEWANRIATEYFQQTEDEKSKGLPVCMPMFDKATCSIPKSQIGFMDYFINDMFESWDAFADLPELMENLSKNYQYWKDEEQRKSSNQDASSILEAD